MTQIYRKIKIHKMELKYVKTFEQFSVQDPELQDLEIVEEGLGDWLKGVNWYKKYWKVAFGYYKKLKNEAGMILAAKMGSEEEKTGWKFTPKDPHFETFRSQLDLVHGAVAGKIGIGVAGGDVSSAAVKPASEAFVEFKKDPTIWDKEIEEYSKKPFPTKK